MNYKIISAITLGILCTSALLLSLKKNSPSKGDTGTLILGTAGNYAPFVSVTPEGDYEGFDIDVAKALANAMGKKLELKDLGSMTALFMALEQGSIDAIIWGLCITQDRLKKVAMIRYQGETTRSFPLIFWGNIPAGIKSIKDMKGMTVCVEPGSSQAAVLSKYPFITTKATEKVDDALLSIQYGKADAAFVEQAIAYKFKKKFPNITTLDVPLAPEDQVMGVGIAIKQTNKTLISEIEKAVATLQSSGFIEKSVQKWGIS